MGTSRSGLFERNESRYAWGMLWDRYRPWWRRALLGANVIAPPWLILDGFSSFVPWVFAVIAHGLLLLAILHPRCPWLGPLVRSFRTEKRVLWLTIDDGPDGAATGRLSEELQRQGVSATFFIIGEKLRRQPASAGALIAAGHTLGNHTATHPRLRMWRLGRSSLGEEVDECAAILRGAGVESAIFRAPVGHKSPGLSSVLSSRGMRQVGWTTGGNDGHDADVSRTVRRIVREARAGGIVLLHECRPHSAGTILAVVAALKAEGFEFVVPRLDSLEEARPARA